MQAQVSGGLIRLGSLVWPACIGHGGAREDKREGDGATPLGLLPLRRVFYRADRGPRAAGQRAGGGAGAR